MSNKKPEPIHVRNEIKRFLEVILWCKIKEEAGIWHITTPEGEKWDMTVPLAEDEKEAWNTVSSSKDLPERRPDGGTRG